jgi:hypothetical protein
MNLTIPDPQTMEERQKMRHILAAERKDGVWRKLNMFRRGAESVQPASPIPELPSTAWGSIVPDPWTWPRIRLITAAPSLSGLPEELISNIMLQSRDIPTMSALSKTNRHFYGIFHTHIDHITTELYASTSRLAKSLATMQVFYYWSVQGMWQETFYRIPRNLWVLQQMLLNEHVANSAADLFRQDIANHPRAEENAFWTDLLFPRAFYLLWLTVLFNVKTLAYANYHYVPIALEAELREEYALLSLNESDLMALYILARLLPLSMCRLSPEFLLSKWRLPCEPASTLFLSPRDLTLGLLILYRDWTIGHIIMAHGPLYFPSGIKIVPHGPKTLLTCYGDLMRYYLLFDPNEMNPRCMYRRSAAHNPWTVPYEEEPKMLRLLKTTWRCVRGVPRFVGRLLGRWRRDKGIGGDHLQGVGYPSLMLGLVGVVVGWRYY